MQNSAADEYLYIVNFTRIEYLRAKAPSAAYSPFSETLRNALSVSAYAFLSFHPYLTALRKSPFRHSIKPISSPDKAHIGMQKSLFRKPIKPISQSEAQKSDLLTEIFRPAKMRKSLFRLRINICSLLFYENILSKKSQAGNVYLCSSRHFQATLTRAHQKLRRQFAVVPTNLYICIIMTT